jgi:hypothetical protein
MLRRGFGRLGEQSVCDGDGPGLRGILLALARPVFGMGLRGRYGISAGNVIGTEIFNLLGVLGLAGLMRPVGVDPMARISLVALSAMVLLVLFFMRTGWRLSRLEGFALIAIAGLRWTFDFLTHGA